MGGGKHGRKPAAFPKSNRATQSLACDVRGEYVGGARDLQVLHLLVGMAAIGQGEGLASRIKHVRPLPQ